MGKTHRAGESRSAGEESGLKLTGETQKNIIHSRSSGVGKRLVSRLCTRFLGQNIWNTRLQF